MYCIEIYCFKVDHQSSSSPCSLSSLSEAFSLTTNATNNGLSFAGRVLKHQCLQSEKASGVYINTNFLWPTSNDVERLFSMVKQVFCPSHHSLQPRTLEALLFLNKNWLLWNPSLVELVVNENASESEDNEHGDEDDW